MIVLGNACWLGLEGVLAAGGTDCKVPAPQKINNNLTITILLTGSPSSLYESHKEHNMASNYKGLYGIFYKIPMEVVKSENIQ